MEVLYHQARNPQTKTEEEKKDSLSKVSQVYLNYFNLANVHYYYKNYNIHKDHGVQLVTRQNCKKKYLQDESLSTVSELHFSFFLA